MSGTVRPARAAQAIERLYETSPADARAIEQHIADLKAEAAKYRQRARGAEAALAIRPNRDQAAAGTSPAGQERP